VILTPIDWIYKQRDSLVMSSPQVETQG